MARVWRSLTDTERASAADEQPFGAHFPNPVQRLLIGLAKRSFLRRGNFRGPITRLVLRLGSGSLDIEFRKARFRIRSENNLIQYGLLLVPEYNAADIDCLLQGAGPASNFVDLGSNIGLYALPIAAACPQGRVVCIDANPKMVDRLRWNAAAGGMQNVRAIQAAVSDTEGTADLLIRKDDLAIVSVRQSETGAVPMRTLAALLAEDGLTALYGLKIDIEGHEDRALVPFLDSAPESLLPQRIVIEHPKASGDYAGCVAAFARHGYRLAGRSRNNSFYLRNG